MAQTTISYTLSGLTNYAPIYFRAVGSNVNGYVRGGELTATPCQPIVFDHADSVKWSNKTPPAALTTKIGTGSRQYLLVAFDGRITGTGKTIDSVLVDSANGRANVRLDSLVSDIYSGNIDLVCLYGTKAVPHGTRTVNVHFHTMFYGSIGAMSFFNVNQTTPIGTATHGSTSSSPHTFSLTNNSGNWVADATGPVKSTTVGTGQTLAIQSGPSYST